MMNHKCIEKEISVLTVHFGDAIHKACVGFSFPRMILKAAGNDHDLRMKVLEFIDLLPSLQSSRDIYEHFNMLIIPCRQALPLILKYGTYCFNIPVLQYLGIQVMLWLVYCRLAPYFIVKDEKMLRSVQKKYARDGAKMSIDFLGELVTSHKEAQYFFNQYCIAIKEHKKEEEPFHISIKFSSLYPFFGPENYYESKQRVSDCFEEILRFAREHNVFVTVDAEQHSFRHLVEDIFCDVISQEEFKEVKNVSIALQAYRKDVMESSSRFIKVGKSRETPFGIRLVKGAYWDTELALAEQKNWPMPLFEKKEDTDKSFNHVLGFLLSHWGDVYVSPATHNPASIAYAFYLARELKILDDENFTFQVLYGLGDPVRKVLCENNLPVIVYTPVGNISKGMSYFARRILENTSNEGFLFKLLG